MPHLPDRGQIFIPDRDFKTGEATTLGRIEAVRVICNAAGKVKLEDSVLIDADTRVELCGDGYNQWTVKIRLAGEYFFVFRADLNELVTEKPATVRTQVAAN